MMIVVRNKVFGKAAFDLSFHHCISISSDTSKDIMLTVMPIAWTVDGLVATCGVVYATKLPAVVLGKVFKHS